MKLFEKYDYTKAITQTDAFLVYGNATLDGKPDGWFIRLNLPLIRNRVYLHELTCGTMYGPCRCVLQYHYRYNNKNIFSKVWQHMKSRRVLITETWRDLTADELKQCEGVLNVEFTKLLVLAYIDQFGKDRAIDELVKASRVMIEEGVADLDKVK